MKRKITILLVVAATMLLTAALPAGAANGKAPDGGCQVGADNEFISEWQMFSQDEFAQLLITLVGMDEDVAEQRAAAIWDFNDHNNDGFLCVMNAELPNDAAGKWLLIEDNHPYGGP